MTRHPVRLVLSSSSARVRSGDRTDPQLPLRFRARRSPRVPGDSDVDSDGLMDGFDEEDRAGQ